MERVVCVQRRKWGGLHYSTPELLKFP
jgi:hypothetical protein